MRRILVALCSCAGQDTAALHHIQRSLEGHFAGVVVRCPGALCQNPSLLTKIAQAEEAEGIVVGACAQEEHRLAFERAAQRARLAPLAVLTVDLKGWHPPTPNSDMARARATLLLAGAIARLQTSREATPQTVRLRLAPLSTPVSRRTLFRLPPLRYQEVAVLDGDLCAAGRGCRLCIQGCPYQALEAGDDAIHVARENCEGCGLCAPLCPVGAIDLPLGGIAPVRAEVQSLLTFPEAHIPQRAIAFTCRCGTLSSGDATPPSVLNVAVPCLGMLPLEIPLLVTALGGTGVAMVDPTPCPHHATQRIKERVALLADLLEALGLGRERVVLLKAAPSAQREALHRLANLAPPAPLRAIPQGGFPALVLALAQRSQTTVHIEHSASPLGVVEVSQACTLCGACTAVCPPQALTLREEGQESALTFDAFKCTACGLCAHTCPEKAITLWQGVDTAHLARGVSMLAKTAQALCQACGRPFMPLALVQRVQSMLVQQGITNLETFTTLCPDCRVLPPNL